MDKTKELGIEPVGKLLAKYSIPAVIAMIVNAIYNVVDRIFIGQFAGEQALGGLTVAFPMMMLVISLASLVGAGGTSLMSIKLGKNDKAGCKLILGNSVTLSVILTILMMVVFYPALTPILKALGATDTLVPFASSYMRIIMIGFIFQMVSFVLGGAIRIEGYPMFSMITMLVPAVVNIILDYVFIGLMKMGVAGAAAATVTGQAVGFILILSFYFRKKAKVVPDKSDYKLDFSAVKGIFTIGFTSFLSSIGTCVAMVFMNRALSTYGGDNAITAMGAIGSLTTMFIMPMLGIQQGMQPIIGYNHGAGYKKRVTKTLFLSIVSSSIFGIITFIALKIAPSAFLGMFLSKSSSTMTMAVDGLGYNILLLPVLSVSFMGTAYFQSIAKAKEAVILGSLRQFILLIPLVLILPKFFQLKGLWMATPVADFITIILTGILLFIQIKKEPDAKSNDMKISA